MNHPAPETRDNPASASVPDRAISASEQAESPQNVPIGKRRPYVFHSLSECAGCGARGDDFACVNVEAHEVTGELYCDECADEAIQQAAEDAA